MTALRAGVIVLVLFLASGSTASIPPRIAIIIDDLGYRLAAGRRAIELPGPVSFAVLPGAPKARLLAVEAFERGKEVLLHLPLQASPNDTEQEPLGIRLDTSRQEFRQLFELALTSVPHAIGVNGHRGTV